VRALPSKLPGSVQSSDTRNLLVCIGGPPERRTVTAENRCSLSRRGCVSSCHAVSAQWRVAPAVINATPAWQIAVVVSRTKREQMVAAALQRLDGHGDARRCGSRSRNTAIARPLGLEGRCLPLSHIPNVHRVTPREAAAATLRLSLRRIARSCAGSGSPCSHRNSGLLARNVTRTLGTKKATGPRWNGSDVGSAASESIQSAAKLSDLDPGLRRDERMNKLLKSYSSN
jgi:hypothetical protein